MSIYSRNNHPPGYYVYAFIDQNKNPYYIGKGSGKRAWDTLRKTKPPLDDNYIVILESNLTEFSAFALERRMIKWYGRKDNGGFLLNQNDGGYGSSGYKMTKDQLEAKKLRNNSDFETFKKSFEQWKINLISRSNILFLHNL